MSSLIFASAICAVFFVREASSDGIEVPTTKLVYPATSTAGLLLVIAIPLQESTRTAYTAYNWEANYIMPPDTRTRYEWPPVVSRDDTESVPTGTGGWPHVDRRLVYDGIETKLVSLGYKGKPCLLRMICESAFQTLSDVNGVLGDILHIVFTPSTSINTNLDKAYERAEQMGKIGRNCTQYEKKCNTSFMNIISWIGHAV